VWLITAWQCLGPEVTGKGFKMCCMSSALECYGMAVKRMRMLGESVRKIKALTMEMATVTMIGKVDRISHVL
jgi:hypothetical protein